MILLTEEEMEPIYNKCVEDEHINSFAHEVAKAQLKKVVEEQLKPCITFRGNCMVEFELTEECWQTILREIE